MKYLNSRYNKKPRRKNNIRNFFFFEELTQENRTWE